MTFYVDASALLKLALPSSSSHRRLCEAAAEIGEVTGARTLDTLHLGAARTAGGGTLPFVTFDLRQAQVARALGWVVLGS